MIQRPNAVGLKVCQQAIVEERTRHVTLVNCFRKLTFATFPAPGVAFTVCVVLTDGIGEFDLHLAIAPLSTLEDLAVRSWKAKFSDPLKERWFLVPFHNWHFPAPESYQVHLRIGQEVVAQAIFKVVQKGE